MAGFFLPPAMTDDELLRYSRHLLLDEIGVEGQARLTAAHALLVGAGGLGSPAALFLGTAGVGQLTLVDPDTVDLTNLQRQIAHAMDRIGQPKVASAGAAITALNPGVRVSAMQQRADAALLDEVVPGCQVVLDCSDNFDTRQAVNATCFRHGVPLVSGSALRFDGQLAVFDPRQPSSPCYACLFPPQQAPEEVACATMGVFAPLVGVIGSLQAAEALRVLAGIGTPAAGRLLMFDALRTTWTEVKVPRQPQCPVCGHRPLP